MEAARWNEIEKAKEAAIEVLLHNSHGPYRNLPRTAGWGYPEPYTRDLLISTLGVLVSGNKELIGSIRKVLETLAGNQSRLGHMPGLVHDPDDRGSSDSTPLFILAVVIFRKAIGEAGFLEEALQKAMTWMEYQSPANRIIVAQQPTSDWRDEQWILGYGLYVNTIVYSYLRYCGLNDRADRLKKEMNRFTIQSDVQKEHIQEGLMVPHKPFFAAWVYKVLKDERFDLLGNSLAILSGLASPSRAKSLISWIELQCRTLREQGELAFDLPPNYFPYVRRGEQDWHPRYEKYNLPGEYHNGGVWPFICAFYVAAIVAAGKYELAEKKLMALTELIRPAREAKVGFGFNEWFRAQDATPRGSDWQSWSAAMYVYAASCVEQKRTPFFDDIRSAGARPGNA